MSRGGPSRDALQLTCTLRDRGGPVTPRKRQHNEGTGRRKMDEEAAGCRMFRACCCHACVKLSSTLNPKPFRVQGLGIVMYCNRLVV